MSNGFVLAIDLGTTNSKVLLFDENLVVVERVSVEYPFSVPQPGWAEQSAEGWWAVVKESIRRIATRVDAHSIRVVGLSGQMHGLVALNAQGKVLRPAILWNDQRSFLQCQKIYEAAGGIDGLLDYTDNPILPGYMGGKILWMRDSEPDIYRLVAHVMLPKDYIRYRLTGQKATDVSDASGTGMFNVKARNWAFELIDKLNIPTGWFPDSYESFEIVGEVTASAAAETGLAPSTPVTAGGGDAVMQTVGSAAINSDTLLVVIGTGGNVTISLPQCIDNSDARLQVFCHVIPDRWTAMGVTLAAGNSLRWFRDTLGGQEVQMGKELAVDPYELLGQKAIASPAGSKGLVFLPYLQGERCPMVDVNARGTFVGLGSYTNKGDIIRSIMEGVAFSFRDVLKLIVQTGISPEKVHVSGGGASSPLWRQVLADVLNRPVYTLDRSGDAGAVGAGIIAGVGVGMWPSADTAVALIKTRTKESPIAENVAIYEKLFNVYCKLYSALKPQFDELASLRL